MHKMAPSFKTPNSLSLHKKRKEIYRLNCVSVKILMMYSIYNIKEKLVKANHHSKVFKHSLATGLVPKGLRLKKSACFGKVSEHFNVALRDILRISSRKLRTKRDYYVRMHALNQLLLNQSNEQMIEARRKIEEKSQKLKRLLGELTKG